jgi:hypothetical protein
MHTIRKLMDKKKIYEIQFSFALLFTLFAFIFSRSFVGLIFFGFRLGEIIMLFSTLSYIYFTFIKIDSNPLVIRLKYINFVLLSIFFANLYLSESSIWSTYTYKTSTYMWSIGFLIIGIFGKKFRLNKASFALFIFVIINLYLTSIYGFPTWIQEFFQEYSDKYEPHKAADIVLILIIFSIYSKIYLKDNFRFFAIQSIIFSLFLPLLLYKSRASFIAMFVYGIYFLFSHLSKIKFNSYKSLFLFIACFTVATFSTIVSQRLIIEEFSVEEIGNSYVQLSQYKFETYVEERSLLYLNNNRLFSADGNLNWRLQMWQDQIIFTIEDGNIFTGMGHKDILKVFIVETPSESCNLDDKGTCGNNRRGLDGLNETLHNFFVTLFARGGLTTLLVFIYLFYYLIKNVNKALYFDLLFLLLSILFVSSFDSSMENAHFPLIFYLFIGNHFFNNNLKY